MRNEGNMAFNQNIAQEYNRNKILTASPAELTLMLYEGAIKFCNMALIAQNIFLLIFRQVFLSDNLFLVLVLHM